MRDIRYLPAKSTFDRFGPDPYFLRCSDGGLDPGIGHSNYVTVEVQIPKMQCWHRM